MKNSVKNLDMRKVIGTVIGGIVFICCMLYFTYAFYNWRSTNTVVDLTIEDISGGECIIGPDVNAVNIGPVLNIQDGVIAEFSVSNDSTSATEIALSLDITSIHEDLREPSFKYALVQNTGSGYNYDSFVLEGNFENVTDNQTLVLADTDIDTTDIPSITIDANSTYSYQFIVYIDGSVYNPSSMQSTETETKGLYSSLMVGECGSIGGIGETSANEPNLDGGNLIPVYYDNGAWKKADSSNTGNSWYNYDDKKWANAVLINDDTKRYNYQNADVNTTITESDITAFYVWIPRYKYQVWNIARRGSGETDYAYSAYTDGINIKWENGTETTGNVSCQYISSTVQGESNLSDNCVYNETDIITTDSVNGTYVDAWYTHPAFEFDGVSKTGFWIGKFETSGEANAPKILPDVVALTNQTVSEQFTSSKVFQTYGLSNDIYAHMLTNLEWGAVAYLTHSDYGLCSDTGCRDVYINNSSSYYTGRSGGQIANSTSLQLNTFYNDSSLQTYQYSSSGYYNYKGYKYNKNNVITSEIVETKIASTTGNITGVYDMSGGCNEYVMGNMLDSNNAFYPSDAGTSWNGNDILDSKYYNDYSNGTGINYKQIALNRSRLGDAMAEVTGGSSNSSSAWKPGAGITGVGSSFVSDSGSWVVRGGYYDGVYGKSGIFAFSRDAGGSYVYFTFRSSLS